MSKEKRKEIRQQRREKIKNLIAMGKGISALPKTINAGNYQQVFKAYWPFLREAFSFIKLLKVTGPRTDVTMDELILLGNAIADNSDEAAQVKFQEKMSIVWGPLHTILEIVIAFSPSKVDDVLDKVIEIGDWLSDSKQTESASLTE